MLKRGLMTGKGAGRGGIPGESLPYSWSSISNGATCGTDSFTRTVAKSNILLNAPVETTDFDQDLDRNRARLHSANDYLVAFAKDRTPPVDRFWSLALHGVQHIFVSNEIDRYSLGKKNKTPKYNPDSSLTIDEQTDAPPDAQRPMGCQQQRMRTSHGHSPLLDKVAVVV